MAVNNSSANGRKPVPPTATLIAEVPVVVVDVSRCGCLIETTRPLDPGAVGTLRLGIEGREYVEDFRVARCTALSGRGSTYRVGVEFLRTRRMTDVSLRHAVTHLVALRPGAASSGSDHAAGSTGDKGARREHETTDREVYR